MKPKILIVDDNEMIRVVATNILQDYECDVLEAGNGSEGLTTAKREMPDAIILDYCMPVMDGLAMLAKLKADPGLRNIPVLMLTSEAGRETVLKIATLGVRDYLIKPFKKDLLLERIRRVLDIKSKAGATAKGKRFDEALNLIVVDTESAIIEQVRSGLADTPWNVVGFDRLDEVLDYCSRTVPDVVFISLTLPYYGAYKLLRLLRSDDCLKRMPVFALGVETAADELERVQQANFAGLITKPFDFEGFKSKVTQALNLDTSGRFFRQSNGAMLMVLPQNSTAAVVREVMVHLRTKLNEAVEVKLDNAVMDLSRLDRVDIHLIKLGLMTIHLCKELALKCSIVCSDAVRQECNNYEETKDWIFVSSLEEAVATLGPKVAVAA